MHRIARILLGILALCLFTASGVSSSCKLLYKLIPGQIWIATISSEVESENLDRKETSQMKSTIEYTVSSSSKEGWVNLSARIKSEEGAHGGMQAQPIDLSTIQYTGNMKGNGEKDNIQYIGSALPSSDNNARKLPPKKAAIHEQSLQMIIEIWKNTIFWFPKLPEHAMKLGDGFESVQEMDMENEGDGMSMAGGAKQTFVLKEIRDGLAFFSINGCTTTQSSAVMMGKSTTKTEGKGEAIFNLEKGMWIDIRIKSQSQVHFGNRPGKPERSQEMYQISKIHMEEQEVNP